MTTTSTTDNKFPLVGGHKHPISPPGTIPKRIGRLSRRGAKDSTQLSSVLTHSWFVQESVRILHEDQHTTTTGTKNQNENDNVDKSAGGSSNTAFWIKKEEKGQSSASLKDAPVYFDDNNDDDDDENPPPRKRVRYNYPKQRATRRGAHNFPKLLKSAIKVAFADSACLESSTSLTNTNTTSLSSWTTTREAKHSRMTHTGYSTDSTGSDYDESPTSTMYPCSAFPTAKNDDNHYDPNHTEDNHSNSTLPVYTDITTCKQNHNDTTMMVDDDNHLVLETERILTGLQLRPTGTEAPSGAITFPQPPFKATTKRRLSNSC